MPFQILRNGREKVRRMPPSTRPMRGQALLTVEVTRSHPEGLKGAEATASAIYPAHRPPENA